MGIGAAVGTMAGALGASTAVACGIGAAATAAVGIGGTLLAKSATGAKAPTPPPAPAPTPMPVMDQAAIDQATQRQAALAAALSDRPSTVLSQTGQSDKLG